MDTQGTANPVIDIASLDELVRREADIVARINNAPNGGRLFMADPIRLLKELNVILSPAAQQEIEAKLGALQLAANPLRRLYDDFKRDGPDPALTINVRGIVPK